LNRLNQKIRDKFIKNIYRINGEGLTGTNMCRLIGLSFGKTKLKPLKVGDSSLHLPHDQG
jgi:hypothetical protein